MGMLQVCPPVAGYAVHPQAWHVHSVCIDYQQVKSMCKEAQLYHERPPDHVRHGRWASLYAKRRLYRHSLPLTFACSRLPPLPTPPHPLPPAPLPCSKELGYTQALVSPPSSTHKLAAEISMRLTVI